MARRPDVLHLFRCPPCLSVVFIVTTLLHEGCRGMRVTSAGPSTLQRAEGERVTLGCTYVPGPADAGDLDIEWSAVSSDATQKDQLLMSYTRGTKYVHSSQAMAQGLNFATGDPSMGDASLSIASLSPAHSSIYQCKVRKGLGVDTRKVSLEVMVRPSVPKCWVEGGGTVGQTVTLRCTSTSGSAPLSYTWRRQRGGPIPPLASQNTATGELAIRNHSESFTGIYLCEATNSVGAAQCRIDLKAYKPPNKAEVIIGTVVGSLLLVVLLGIFVGIGVYKYKSRPHRDKQVSNELRVDALAPVSRPISRSTSHGSSLHPSVAYSQVGTAEDSGRDRQRTHTPSTNSPSRTPANDDDSMYGIYVV